jgi:uncharacterized protein (DUF427 family)
MFTLGYVISTSRRAGFQTGPSHNSGKLEFWENDFNRKRMIPMITGGITPGLEQESVRDYPRPPIAEDVARRIRVIFNRMIIVDTRAAKRVLETSHPPVYYLPRRDVRVEYLDSYSGSSWCEWKGRARFFSVRVGDRFAERAAWCHPEPTQRFTRIKGHIAFYCGPMDACHVGDERVQPQPGGFYGGWITSDVVGPFKGAPGSMGW